MHVTLQGLCVIPFCAKFCTMIKDTFYFDFFFYFAITQHYGNRYFQQPPSKLI